MKLNIVQGLIALGLVIAVPVTLALTHHQADLGFVVASIVPVGTAVLTVVKSGAS